MTKARILLLDPGEAAGLTSELLAILTPAFEVTAVAGADDGLPALAAHVVSKRPDLIFVLLPKGLSGSPRELLRAVSAEAGRVPCLAVLEAGAADETFELLRCGAADFIIAPLKEAEVLPRAWRLLEQTRREEALPRVLKEKLGMRNIVGSSPAFLAEIRKVPLVAKCDACVLISGETGTGKEVYARAVHYLSPREHKPFIPVNCGAIPVELVENELFGHERGAFTGAATSRPGLLHEAEGGTLFLDEIDCLPLLAQVKLLRFIQEKEYRPLGSTKTCRADVRIIGASNVDFEEAVGAGRLRKDLYYRLNVIRLTLPPLRERREDIPLLARHFLRKYAAEYGRELSDIAVGAVESLMLHDWPGNVRELEHAVARAVILAEQEGGLLTFVQLSDRPPEERAETFQQAKNKTVTQFERAYIQKLLLAYGGNITRAAQAARKNRRAFWELIRKHRIDVSHFKPYA
jgi:two-component system, NtrC family, response regulator GlrR